jgi:hypothetical protein
MFNLILKYFGFLKHVPLLPHLYDACIRIHTAVTKPKVLGYIDEIEAEVLLWNNTSTSIHKFGGIQFDLEKKEIGHIHSNGLLDILFNRQTKDLLIKEGRVTEHHTFKNSGWVSFYIRNVEDKGYALELLSCSYNKIEVKVSNSKFPFLIREITTMPIK